MTCPQNCDFVLMEVGIKDESAWCGMTAVLVGGVLAVQSVAVAGRFDNLSFHLIRCKCTN